MGRKLTLPLFRSSDTGVIECQIRLPCNHTLGSACIATWLKSNNTCPVCRHVLFPRPADDDDDDVDDDDDESQIVRSGRTSPVYIDTDDEEYDEHLSTRVARAARISELTFSYSAALHLNASITICSHGIAEKCGSLNSLPGRSEASIAAASVYMASHIGLQPKTLREISQLADNTEGTIQTVYRRIYAYFHTMPEGTWTQICRGLPWHSDDVSSISALILQFPYPILEPLDISGGTRKSRTTPKYPSTQRCV